MVAAEGASAPRHFHSGERVALPLAWSWTFGTKSSNGSGRRLRLSSEHTGFKFEQSVKQASVAESIFLNPFALRTSLPSQLCGTHADWAAESVRPLHQAAKDCAKHSGGEAAAISDRQQTSIFTLFAGRTGGSAQRSARRADLTA